MKLLITSNGIVNPELERALEELTGGQKNLRVAIIPTASEPIEWVPDMPESKNFIPKLTKIPLYETNPTESGAYKEWKNRGFEDIYFVSLREDPKKVENELRNAEIISIPGGDVDYLLLWAKKSGLDRYWREILNRETICVTQSAGCGLLSPNVGFRWWTPDEKLDVNSFNIVNFIPIVHQKEDDPEKNYDALIDRKEYMKENFPGGFPWPLYLIPDGQGILINGSKIDQVGLGDKKII